MKFFKTIYFQVGLLSVALFIVSQVFFVPIFEFFEPHVDGILFHVIELPGNFKTSILFSLILFLIPFLLLFTWRLAPIASPTKRIASLLTILICITIGIFSRHEGVKSYFNRIAKNLVLRNHNMPVNYPLDPVNFVYRIFIGLCVGCIISYFLFRQKKLKLNYSP